MFDQEMVPAIKEFPRDGRYWRIDWFGGVQRNDRIPDEPHIHVVISPLKIDLPTSPKALSSVDATNHQEQRTILVGIGQLPFLFIGSIWKDGYIIPCDIGETKTFNNLFISDEFVTLHNPNMPFEKGWLIPKSHYRLYYGRKAFCLSLPYQGNPHGIIVPAIELLRFYYATSSRLCRYLLNGRFIHDINEIVNLRECGISPDGAGAWLQLRMRTRDTDRWTIGRILFSPQALACVQGLYRSIVAQRSKGPVVFLPASFPFTGPTNLTATIKRIQSSDKKWRFLVLSLQHCTDRKSVV